MAIVARFGYKIKRRKRSHDLRMVVKGNICLISYKGDIIEHASLYSVTTKEQIRVTTLHKCTGLSMIQTISWYTTCTGKDCHSKHRAITYVLIEHLLSQHAVLESYIAVFCVHVPKWIMVSVNDLGLPVECPRLAWLTFSSTAST